MTVELNKFYLTKCGVFALINHCTDVWPSYDYGQHPIIKRFSGLVSYMGHQLEVDWISYSNQPNILLATRWTGYILTPEQLAVRSLDIHFDNEKTPKNKCECGSYTIGFSHHSHWCPSFEAHK